MAPGTTSGADWRKSKQILYNNNNNQTFVFNWPSQAFSGNAKASFVKLVFLLLRAIVVVLAADC